MKSHNNNKKTTSSNRNFIYWLTLIWFSLDAFTHLTIELG